MERGLPRFAASCSAIQFEADSNSRIIVAYSVSLSIAGRFSDFFMMPSGLFQQRMCGGSSRLSELYAQIYSEHNISQLRRPLMLRQQFAQKVLS